MQQELIEMLEKMVKYFDELPSDSYYADETCSILTEAEKLVKKAKNNAPAQDAGLTEDQADAVSMALRRAWRLGQTYWQQADSDYISQHKKSEETQRKFEKLCDDTISALRAKENKS